MVTYSELYAYMQRVETGVNNPLINVPVINTSGLYVTEKMQHLAGLFIAQLLSFYTSVQRGGGSPILGYEQLRDAVSVLVYAKQTFSLSGGPEKFSLSLFEPDDVDEVTEKVVLQELDTYSRTNVFMLVGRLTICTEQNDISAETFSYWLDECLRALAFYCFAHDIDMQRVISMIPHDSAQA